jgi:hypothetical protein
MFLTTRPVPFTKGNVLQVAVLALLPAMLLELTMIPLNASIIQLMRVLF